MYGKMKKPKKKVGSKKIRYGTPAMQKPKINPSKKNRNTKRLGY